MNLQRSSKAATAHHNIWRGLAAIRVFALSLVYFGTSDGLYTLGIWAPQIIKGLGLGKIEVGHLNAIPPTVAVIAMYLWSAHSNRTNERTWHIVIACTAPAAALSADACRGANGASRRAAINNYF